MYPHDLHVGPYAISVWNAMFALAVVLAYFVFRKTTRSKSDLSLPRTRFAVVVYLSALAAQFFAYAFDTNTSLLPPLEKNPWAYYLDPLAGPKTLYGVIVLMPVTVGIATIGTRLSLVKALDLWTPAMLVVLTVVRIGCMLQGCCYGARSDMFGLSFPAGSPVYWHQRHAGWIPEDALWSLPVIPTQFLEAIFLGALALWAWRRRVSQPPSGLFLPAVIAYSLFRFSIEFVRADVERGIYGPLATSQWIALVVLAVAALALRAIHARRNRPARLEPVVVAQQ